MNWLKWKCLFYPRWKHGFRIEYVYSASDISWDPNIYFQNIKVVNNNPEEKLLYTLSLSNQPDVFVSGYYTVFWPSDEYSTEDLEMSWDECEEYIKTKYNGQISKGESTVILKTGIKRFCYFIKDDKRKIIYYSDNRDLLMDKLKITPDSLYGRNIWI